MRREKPFWSSWSRFVHGSTAALITLSLVGAARADSIKEFVVSGTALNVSGGRLGTCVAGATCSFSGAMMVDVTSSTMFPSGAVTAIDVTLPGLSPFTMLASEFRCGLGAVCDWQLDAENKDHYSLFLDFTTTRELTLLDFNGGMITGDGVTTPFPGNVAVYRDLRGIITPVPEPSSQALLGSGLIALAGLARRKFKR